MQAAKLSRRDVLKASGAAAVTAFATPIRAAAPEPTAITPALIDAAKKEGKVICYSSIDLRISEKIAKEDTAAVEKNAEEIKARYTKIFRV
jgi:iron(III) transport system substrate-binding protein